MRLFFVMRACQGPRGRQKQPGHGQVKGLNQAPVQKFLRIETHGIERGEQPAQAEAGAAQADGEQQHEEKVPQAQQPAQQAVDQAVAPKGLVPMPSCNRTKSGSSQQRFL